MTIYTNFFCPQTIFLLVCLNEGMQKKNKFRVLIEKEIIKFCVKKILKISDASFIRTTFSQIYKQLQEQIPQIFTSLNQILVKFFTFNDFYREVSTILKQLRSLHKNKIQQGNIIDFFIRRLYAYFEKLNFKQIVQIHQNFQSYLRNEPFLIHQHQFMLTKSIQELKFNLQNYSSYPNEAIQSTINNLSQNDNTFKTSYLKGIIRAQQRIPIESSHQMHRYFDKCLGNLFQQKTQLSNMSNKINHCILSTAYTSLKMGHLQQCLQAVSEGLRISQNNTDQQSINNCIMYLSKVAQQLGRYQQQILLTQHAINHALNLNNPLLTLYSCLIYSGLCKHHLCDTPSLSLLKNSHTCWTDALHTAHKKLHLQFQSNCKNIYHSYRSLLIPLTLHKISRLLHLPELQSLLFNPYITLHQIKSLTLYKEYKRDTHLNQLLQQTRQYYDMGMQHMVGRSINTLTAHRVYFPLQIVEINALINDMIADNEQEMYVVERIHGQLLLCAKYGFRKEHTSTQQILHCRVLLRNGLYEDALVQLGETMRVCCNSEDRLACALLTAQAHLRLGEYGEPIHILTQIEENGQLSQASLCSQYMFQETKWMVYEEIGLLPLLPSEKSIVAGKSREIMQGMLGIALEMKNINKVSYCLAALRSTDQKIGQAYAYCEWIKPILRAINYEIDNLRQMQGKVMEKIRSIIK